MCGCNEGYELKEDKKTCQKIHPCDKETKGGCEQVCNKDGEKAKCSCDPKEDYKLEEDGSCTKSKNIFSSLFVKIRLLVFLSLI